MANARILVVEDEGIIAKDLDYTLKGLGYTVPAIAFSGEDAIKKAAELRPDLVVIDIVLKGHMDGVQAAEEIRDRFDIPVIYLTAYSDDKTLERAKVTQPFGYIVKPFDERELYTNIEMVLFKHNMERKLRESKQWLSTTLRCIGDAVVATDVSGFVTFMNPVAETLTGCKEEHVTGKPLREVFSIVNESTGRRVEDPAGKILRTTVPERLGNDAILIGKDGTSRPIDDSVASIRDDKGNISGVVHVFRDTTERRRAEKALRQSERKCSAIIESSMTGIYIDQNGKIVFANNRFAEIYKYPREELVGIQAWRLVHPEDRALTNLIRAKRLRGEDAPSEYEARGLTKDGQTIWIKRRNIRIEYEGGPAILGNIVDITEQKRADEELRKINEELENFVRVVSHDLKNPIIAIQGFSSRLLKNCQAELGERSRGYLEQIMASARRMGVLVSDLEALAVVGQVVSNFRNIPSSEIVREVTSALQERLNDGGIELVVTDNFPIIYCDGERLYQVFENLLVNAIKYMGDTRNPKIEIGYEDKGNFDQFYVRDNGIGIDPKYHRRIFEMFQRLREKKDEEGTGLGLAIVDRIVSNHGGKVWVESKKGRGATFHFTLPKDPGLGRQS